MLDRSPLESALEEPSKLVSLVDQTILGMWNATGTGRSTHGQGWWVVDVCLEREDQDETESTVELLLAAFEAREPWSALVTVQKTSPA